MTFTEWVERSIPMTDKEKIFAGFAWMAATKAEREECAGICDRFAARDMHPAECAGAIRMRSNAEITGRTLAQNEADGA